MVGRPLGFLTCGVDVASSTITEICVEASSPGGLETWMLRIHLSGWDWYSQAALILALEEQLQPERGWGLDATGAGKGAARRAPRSELRDAGAPLGLRLQLRRTRPESGER